ncbi:MAG: ERF family protein [Candidatus Limiplasma sp.]|nr:ERF family protein [Candidatus Limiplasma sp.]
MKNLIAAVRDVQSELNAPKNRHSSFGKYDYRSCEDILEAVKPLLKQHGLMLTITDSIEQVGARYYVKATAEVTDGEHAVSACAYAREPDTKKGMDESQLTGTASSYARKYALNGLFCIDDQKDADTDENALQTQNAAAQQPNPTQQIIPPKCEACGQEIHSTKTRSAEEVMSATRRRYGMALCVGCAKDYQKSVESASA